MRSFNECIGPEQLGIEYKEFSLHKTGFPFDTEKAIHYCTTNRFEFDELVMATIPKYIDYVPKYACGFWNTGMPGELYIGVDDLGCIKGIPLSTNQSIDLEWVTKMVRDKIASNLSSEDGAFEIPISVSIEQVRMPEKEEGIHPSFDKFMKKKQAYMEEYQEFLAIQARWNQTYEYVSMKLTDIVNQPLHRLKLINFMEQSDHRNETALQTIRRSDYLLPDVAGEGIVRNLKQDQSNVFYWVTTFKDELTEQYKKGKPVFTKTYKYKNTPFNLLIGLSEMVPYWVGQINLYMIRISFGRQPTTRFKYYNGNEWIKCHRVIDHNQPVCMPQ